MGGFAAICWDNSPENLQGRCEQQTITPKHSPALEKLQARRLSGAACLLTGIFRLLRKKLLMKFIRHVLLALKNP